MLRYICKYFVKASKDRMDSNYVLFGCCARGSNVIISRVICLNRRRFLLLLFCCFHGAHSRLDCYFFWPFFFVLVYQRSSFHNFNQIIITRKSVIALQFDKNTNLDRVVWAFVINYTKIDFCPFFYRFLDLHI